MKRAGIIFLLSLSTSLVSYAQQIINAEYFFNTDPGVGLATDIPIATPGDNVLETFTFSTAGLPNGYNRLWVRTEDDLGRWSLYLDRLFYIYDPTFTSLTVVEPQQITGAEYFIDTDPGVGNGTSISLTSGAMVTENFSIPTTGLTEGYHRFWVRTLDDLGT